MAENAILNSGRKPLDSGVQVIHALSQLLFQGRSQRTVTGRGQRSYRRKAWVPYNQYKKQNRRGNYRRYKKPYRRFKKTYNRRRY